VVQDSAILYQIEHAEQETPFCACGDLMVPIDTDGQIWLECRTIQSQEGGAVALLMSLFARHDRQLIVDCFDQAA